MQVIHVVQEFKFEAPFKAVFPGRVISKHMTSGAANQTKG